MDHTDEVRKTPLDSVSNDRAAGAGALGNDAQKVEGTLEVHFTCSLAYPGAHPSGI